MAKTDMSWKDYPNWKVGTRLLDIDLDPPRTCVVIRAETSRERPRIGVRYDNNGEVLEASHPSHYREAKGCEVCGAFPYLAETGTCGPCTFGTADWETYTSDARQI